MNVGSLFSGIGGFDLGLERAGMRVVWQCESDPYRRAVLRRHWPGVSCFEDVRDVAHSPCERREARESGEGLPAVHGGGAHTGRGRSAGSDGPGGSHRGWHVAEPVDLICGGFPCQDISVAGAGAGIEGTRSGLWSEMQRIVGELRPRYVIVENVSALLARGLGRVLGDLAALGYDAEWDCLPASAFGAPHRRDRVWIVAYPQQDELWVKSAGEPRRHLASVAGDDGAAGSLADADDTGRTQQRWSVAVRTTLPLPEYGSQGVAHADGTLKPSVWSTSEEISRLGEIERSGRCGGSFGDWWSVEPDVGRVAHGVPARVDRLAALGDALVPQVAEWIGRRIMSYEAQCRGAA